jgi:hypothetical protein
VDAPVARRRGGRRADDGAKPGQREQLEAPGPRPGRAVDDPERVVGALRARSPRTAPVADGAFCAAGPAAPRHRRRHRPDARAVLQSRYGFLCREFLQIDCLDFSFVEF